MYTGVKWSLATSCCSLPACTLHNASLKGCDELSKSIVHFNSSTLHIDQLLRDDTAVNYSDLRRMATDLLSLMLQHKFCPIIKMQDRFFIPLSVL